jgi:hypothetical protein
MKCNLCKKEIIVDKEKYVHVEDYDSANLMNEIWCHCSCFNKAMNRELTQMEQEATEMLERIKPMFNKLLGTKQEVYNIQ